MKDITIFAFPKEDKKMKRLTLSLGLVALLLMSLSTANAALLGAYSFESGVNPMNLVTGNTGSIWNAVYQNADNPHSVAGNYSLQLGTTVGDPGSAFLPADQTSGVNHEFTYDYWVKITPEIIANSGMLIGMSDNNWGMRMGINTSGKIAYWAGDYSSGTVTSTTLAANTWYHVAMRYIYGFSDIGTLEVFVNGQSVHQEWGYAWHHSLGAAGVIGYVNPAGLPGITSGHSWGSLIDDLRYYDSAVTNEQIVSDMNTAVVPEPSALVGLLGLMGTGVAFLRKK